MGGSWVSDTASMVSGTNLPHLFTHSPCGGLPFKPTLCKGTCLTIDNYRFQNGLETGSRARIKSTQTVQ